MDVIRKLVDDGVKDPHVNALAIRLARNVPRFDHMAQAQAIYEYVLENIWFVDDPVQKETVRPARVVLQVQAPLLGLLAGLADTVIAREAEPPPFDLRCPLLSLPRAFGTEVHSSPANIPYLRASPAHVSLWSARLGERRRRRIGIAVSGDPTHPEDAQRSIPAAAFLTAFEGVDAELHVLQKDIRAADADERIAAALERAYPEPPKDFVQVEIEGGRKWYRRAPTKQKLEDIGGVGVTDVQLTESAADPTLIFESVDDYSVEVLEGAELEKTITETGVSRAELEERLQVFLQN